MDETGAVDIARGKLERRRQEAYRARAAATVRIQRWYRSCLVAKSGVRSRAGYKRLSREDISNEPSTEKSVLESTSATISNVSEQESEGNLDQRFSEDIIVNPTDSTHSSIHFDHDQTSASESKVSQSERFKLCLSSFDEFVNNEVAVARAMLDQSYMDQLNEAQRKRVERLLAYKRVSDQQSSGNVQEQSQNPLPTPEMPKLKRGAQVERSSSNTGSMMNTQSSPKITKSLIPIPVKSIKKPLQDQQTKDTKTENVSLTAVECTSSVHAPYLLKEVRTKQVDGVNERKLKPSKPLVSNQKEQLNMKDECAVKKQRQSKDSKKVQPSSVSLNVIGGFTELPPTTQDMVKAGNDCQMQGDNEVTLNNHVLRTVESYSNEHTQQTEAISEDITSNSSKERVKLESNDVQMMGQLIHMQRDPNIHTPNTAKQSLRQKVLKVASKVRSESASTSGVQNSIKSPQRSIKPIANTVKQSEEEESMRSAYDNDLDTREKLDGNSKDKTKCHDEQEQLEKERQEDKVTLQQQKTNVKQHQKEAEEQHVVRKVQGVQKQVKRTPINISNATTKLVLHREIRDELEALTVASSYVSQGRSPRGAKRSAMTQTQWLTNAAVQTEEETDIQNTAPENLATGYASIHRRAHGLAEPGRPAAQGGYSFAFAKRKENNKKNKVTEKKQPLGYLQKFLKSSDVQDLLQDLQNTKRRQHTSWHTAWSTAPGGLPDWRKIRRDSCSPPPDGWEAVMSSACRYSASSFRQSHGTPIHQDVRRPPHHLRPLVVPTEHKHLPPKARHCKNHSYNSHYLAHSKRLADHRRSLSQIIARTEMYHEHNLTS